MRTAVGVLEGWPLRGVWGIHVGGDVSHGSWARRARVQQTYGACPGSLGQWCGYGLEYPDGSTPAMITLELPYEADAQGRPEELPEDHLDTLKELWERDAARYLSGVEPGVHAMLAAAVAYGG